MHDPNATAYIPYAFPPNDHDRVRIKAAAEMLEVVALPEVAQILARLILIFVLVMILFLISVPWQQTSEAEGRVIAYLPQERVQNVHAPVSGRIKKWSVREGSVVHKGDPIVEIVDIDPDFYKRLELEREQFWKQYQLAKEVSATTKLDLTRQRNLFERKVGARRDMELAIIAVRSAEGAEAQALANLVQAESKLSRQRSQIVRAPADGTIVRLLVGMDSVIVDQMQVLAVFVPTSKQLAVELLIEGMDLPLVYVGRKARLQFEGWPAVQFSGWPSVATGTFGGRVSFVDQSASEDGQFRVIILPDGNIPWPEERFIRQGTRVKGWVLMGRVSTGYELWRRFNGFPPSMTRPPKTEAPSGGPGNPELVVP